MYKGIEHYQANFDKFPSPAAYKWWVEGFSDMIVHTRGEVPKKLIETRRPYEPEEIKLYRIANYRAVTKDPINRAITNVQRIFSKSLVEIDISNELQQEVDDRTFDGLDFLTYIQQRVIRRMIEDANGLLVWWPTSTGSQSEPAIIDPILALSKNIIHFTEDVVTWVSDEMQGDRKVWCTVDRYGTYTKRIEAEKGGRPTYVIHYQHRENFEWEKLPVLLLGGRLTGKEEKGVEIAFLESFFETYNAFANEAIVQMQDHQGILVTSTFPIREMVSLACNSVGCTGGSVFDELAQTWGNCHVCKGTGEMIPTSPYGTLLKPKTGGLNNETDTAQALKYISPDVAIVRYSGEVWEGLLKRAEKTLNLLFIEEAQSGIAKEVDREDKVATLDLIGRNVFLNLVKGSLEILQELWYLPEVSVDVVLPSTFRVRTDAEIVADMTELRQGNAPEYLIRESAKELIRKRYANNKWTMKIAEVLFIYDPLFALSTAEKNNLLASSAITEKQYARSLYAAGLIERVSTEMADTFIDAEYPAISQRADALLSEIEIPTRQIFSAGGFP